MRIANLVSGAVLILFAIVMLWLVIPAQIEEGPQGMMSPRLVPQMMVWLILGLSVLLVLSNLSRTAQDDPKPFTRDEIVAFVRIGGVFAVSLALFLSIGVLPAVVVLILGSLLALGERRPVILVLMPLCLIGGAYILFYRVLGTAIL